MKTKLKFKTWVLSAAMVVAFFISIYNVHAYNCAGHIKISIDGGANNYCEGSQNDSKLCSNLVTEQIIDCNIATIECSTSLTFNTIGRHSSYCTEYIFTGPGSVVGSGICKASDVQTFTFSTPGTYTVEARWHDSNGTLKETSHFTDHFFTITVNQGCCQLDVNLDVQNNSDCSRTTCNGKITVSVGGGNPPFRYSIDGINFQSSRVFNNLCGGNYIITVIDAKQCSTSVSTTIANTANPPTIALTKTDVTDCNICNGTITATTAGGTSPYQYSSDGISFQSSNIFTGLCAETYTITVKDKNGCIATASVIISGLTKPQINGISIDAPCQGEEGSIVTSVSGGKPDYTYLWNNSKTTPNITEVPGTYTVTVTDANGCSASAQFVINTAACTSDGGNDNYVDRITADCNSITLKYKNDAFPPISAPFPSCGGGGDGGTVDADNGLTSTTSGSNTHIELGGTLHKYTDINLNSNNLTMTNTGNVGINTNSPQVKLHVQGPGADVAFGTLSGASGNFGPGDRMMWIDYNSKYAFRAGSVAGSQWDDVNTGVYSIAMGRNTIASGDISVSLGQSTVASGMESVAIGYHSKSQQPRAMTFGSRNNSNGEECVVIGNDNNNSVNNLPVNAPNGLRSVIIGNESNATGDYAITIGNLAKANGQSSISVGNGATAGTANSFAIGENVTANGNGGCFAIGYNITNSVDGSFAVGFDNNVPPPLFVNRTMVGMGNNDPAQTLDISPASTLSGLRLRGLAGQNPGGNMVLSVDNGTGNVILVPDFIGYCGAPVPALSNVAGMNLNGFNFFFEGASGNVGIGVPCGSLTDGKLGVYNDFSNSNVRAAGFFNTGGGVGSSNLQVNQTAGVYGASQNNTGENFGLYGFADGNATTRNVAVYGQAQGSSTNYGGFFGTQGFSSSPATTTNYAVYAASGGEAQTIYGVYATAGAPPLPGGTNIAGYFSAASPSVGGASWAGYFDGNININGDAYVTSNTWTGSDERYKKNINPLQNTVSNIKQLRGVNYEMRQEEFKEQNFSDGKKFGFIAQEMEKVYPELVHTDSKGYKSINYIGLIPVLTEAIKEQSSVMEEKNKQIEELAKTVEYQNQKAQELEKRIADLESCIAAICSMGSINGSPVNTLAPNSTQLNQNVPNPFTEKTMISYSLGEKSNVELNVYSIEGVLITTLTKGEQEAGSYSVDCCPNSKLAPGSYIYVLKVNGKQLQKKAIMVK